MSKICDDFGKEFEVDFNDVCMGEPIPIGEPIPNRIFKKSM